ncbi:hypothetical protein KCV07_g6567, partial [Aureobasidium melanogenum]
MSSELIKKYRQTCYDRLYNSVIGSAQACSRISGELLETSMQRQTAYNQIWKVIAPDHINDKLHALVITLQEQQMVLELLILVMAFFDAGIVVPSVIHQHRIYHHESKRLENFLDGILEGIRAKHAMRQDILRLSSSSQQCEDKCSTRSSDELPAADTWSSSQSTLTLGAITPTGDWSNVNYDMATSEDRALEDLLETINMKLREQDVANEHPTSSVSMAGNQQHRTYDESDQEFLDGIVGTISACTNLSAKLRVLKETTAVCLRNPLGRLAEDFLSLKQSYHALNNRLDRQKPIWSPAATVLIHDTQRSCQEITTQLSAIVNSSTEWCILAPEGALRNLNTLSASFADQKSRLELPIGIFELVQHISLKPAQHESPDSIIIPDPRSQYAHYPPWDPDVRAANERHAAALRAAQSMEDWSKYLEQCFASIRETLQAKTSPSDTPPFEPQAASGPPQERKSVTMSEGSSEVEDCSSSQTITGIMTPTEDWSDLGNETTETGRALAITRHNLQLCGYATASFMRLLEAIQPPYALQSLDAENIRRLYKAHYEWTDQCDQRLNAPAPPYQHNPLRKTIITGDDIQYCIVNMKRFSMKISDIEQSLGRLPSSTLVEITDVEAMHEEFKRVSLRLLDILSVPEPLRSDNPGPNSAMSQASVQAPAPGESMPVMPEEQKKGFDIDEALEAIIDSMEATPTDTDITKLVFHWTTLNECNGFQRADVMKFNL